MYYFRSASNILRSKLGFKVSLSDAAKFVEILEEESTEAALPLAIVPGALDRVTNGVPGHSTAKEEISRAIVDRFTHAPVVRYVLPNCLVHHGGVEYQGGFLAKTLSIRDRFPVENMPQEELATYCMSTVTHEYFGHWLRDACTTALLAENLDNIILDIRPDWPDATRYANAFKFNAAPSRLLRIKELHVFSDFAQGQLKRSRYAELKARLEQFASAAETVGRPVYLRRGATGVSRLIADEEKLCEQLSQRGFEIVDVAGLRFQERYEKLARAPIAVTVDGSHVNHATFAMKPGASLVTLIPSDRFTMLYRGYLQAMGFRFGCVVIEPSANGYAVSVSDLLRTIDMVT